MLFDVQLTMLLKWQGIESNKYLMLLSFQKKMIWIVVLQQSV